MVLMPHASGKRRCYLQDIYHSGIGVWGIFFGLIVQLFETLKQL